MWLLRSVIRAPVAPGTSAPSRSIGQSLPLLKVIRQMASASSVGNRLSTSRSPYLLQHAHNPVDWWPWGPEAFEEARAKQKPIFLSVGYATCHWCHVMERESFENEEVANVMNNNFVCVKVDREERPDVDKVYMTFVQATTGSGGWPMSVFLTPQLKPFYGGTYFPPSDSFGRPGFRSLLLLIAEKWRDNRSSVLSSSDKMTEALSKATRIVKSDDSKPDWTAVSTKCLNQLSRRFDETMGGFSSAPKFPQAVNFNFLLYLYQSDIGKKIALDMCVKTLEMMSKGGICDHVAKGFARYSTDAKWHVPHFEKMLYDQAQLIVAYSDVYAITKSQLMATVTRDIISYVERDLRHHQSGAFFSAEDADSYLDEEDKGSKHKKEGAFYVFKMSELKSCLGDDAQMMAELFHVEEAGNVDAASDPHGELQGVNVLTRIPDVSGEIVEKFGFSDKKELETKVDLCLEKLFEVRSKRPRPQRDDKILTAWNALMISGYCSAASALQSPDYAVAATKCAAALLDHLYDKQHSTLLRSIYVDEKTRELSQLSKPIDAFSDDYAFLIRALIDLYELTFDSTHIEWAERLQEKQIELFWDHENDSGFYTSAENDSSIVLRLKEDQDGAEPSGNSVSTLNLLRLSSLLDKESYKNKAVSIVKAFADRIRDMPMAVPQMLPALHMMENTKQIIFVGKDKEDPVLKSMIQFAQSLRSGPRVLIWANGDKDSILYRNLAILNDMDASVGPEVHICQNMSCALPVNTLEDFKKALNDP